MKLIDFLAGKLGYIKKSEITEKLDFGYSVAKRLDEHRELVEAIEEKTSLFKEYEWHVGHCAIQDDYLMRLYFLVHEEFPSDFSAHQMNGGEVRARPKILGECTLPEYKKTSIKRVDSEKSVRF